MSFYVYGLRVRGEPETRYIGQTEHDPAHRLAGHLNIARQHGRPTSFVRWLTENANEIEAFKIAVAETRDEARAIERVLIALCLRLNNRLFNLHGVPAELQIPKWEALAVA